MYASLSAEVLALGAGVGLDARHVADDGQTEAAAHLEAFLEMPPTGAEADRWVRHARQTLDELRSKQPEQPEV